MNGQDIVIFSGLPREIFQALFAERRAFIARDEYLIGINHEHGDKTSSDEVATRICDAVRARITVDPQKRYALSHVINIYFDLGTEAFQLAIKSLAFSYNCSIKVEYKELYNEIYGHKKHKKTFVGVCARELREARKGLRALRTFIQEQDAKTPLLLPLRNFQSKTLAEELLGLTFELTQSNNKDDAAAKAVAAISNNLKTAKMQKQWAFIDDKGRRFLAPSMSGPRHGQARNHSGVHQDSCFLNGRFRLGIPYDPRFHYDCSRDRAKINGLFLDCHGSNISVQSCDYLNIAPNDYIRL